MRIKLTGQVAGPAFAVTALLCLAVVALNKGDISESISMVKAWGIPGVILIGIIAVFGKSVYTTYKKHQYFEKYPGPPRESFFSGNYNQMRAAQAENTLFDLFRDWVIEHGDTILFWRQSGAKFFTADPDIIRSMLTEITVFKKIDAIPNRTLFGQRITGTTSFLTVTEGKTWAQKRKVMSPYFSKLHLSDMFGECHDYVKRGVHTQLAEVKMGETNVDLVWFYGELFQFFLGALGFDLGCGLVSKNAPFHNKAIQGILKWVPHQFGTTVDVIKMRFQPEVSEVISYIVKLRNICKHILDTKTDEYEQDGPKPDDIVHHIITSNNSIEGTAGQRLTWMMDDMMTSFLVIDNMAKTLATLFVRLMRDERVYKKVCEEVRSADLTTLQSMDKSLRYTEMVILETLRLHPTLMRGIRDTKQEVKLSNGLTLPKRSMIFFGQLVLHKHPKYWENPLEWYPERFETGSKNITPFTYLPFIAGPRVCMGKHLAMLSMKLSIVYSLKNHDMRPSPGEEKEMDWDYRFTIVRPTKGHNAVFTPVEQTAGS